MSRARSGERSVLCRSEQLAVGRRAGEKIGQTRGSFEARQRHDIVLGWSCPLLNQVNKVGVLQRDLDHRAHAAREVAAESLAGREDFVHLRAILVGDGTSVGMLEKLRHVLVATRGFALRGGVASSERDFIRGGFGQDPRDLVCQQVHALDVHVADVVRAVEGVLGQPTQTLSLATLRQLSQQAPLQLRRR